jgi:hypothetical protein
MQRAALIVQIEQTVMMVSIECPVMDSDMFMVVGCYRHRLVDVERVVPKQRQHAERLRSDKQRQQRCANAPNSSEKSHGFRLQFPRALIIRGNGPPNCGRDATVPKYFSLCQTKCSGAKRQTRSPSSIWIVVCAIAKR